MMHRERYVDARENMNRERYGHYHTVVTTLILTSLSRKLLWLPIGCILFWYFKTFIFKFGKGAYAH